MIFQIVLLLTHSPPLSHSRSGQSDPNEIENAHDNRRDGFLSPDPNFFGISPRDSPWGGRDQTRTCPPQPTGPPTADIETTTLLPAAPEGVDTTLNTVNPPIVDKSALHNPLLPVDVIEPPEELLNDMIAESSPNQQNQQGQMDVHAGNNAEKKPLHPIWIHKADYRPITQEECDSLKCDMMKTFLSLARNGELTIDFRFTSRFSDLQSGKIKLTSESLEAAEAIKLILSSTPFWKVLAADDLNTQARME